MPHRLAVRGQLWALGLGFLVLPSATPPATAQETGRAPQSGVVADEIEKILVEEGIPSIAVAVAIGGNIVWVEGFGWADREARRPATAHTPYSLASISKPMTATGLMVLVERGEIDLDAPVNDYLGDAKLP